MFSYSILAQFLKFALTFFLKILQRDQRKKASLSSSEVCGLSTNIIFSFWLNAWAHPPKWKWDALFWEMHVLLHYLSQLVVKMFPKSPAHDWWSFGLLAPSSQQTPVKCILGRVPAQLPFPCRERLGRSRLQPRLSPCPKRKINQKSQPAAGFLKISFPEGGWGQETLRKGDIWSREGGFLGEEWYKSTMWDLPMPCWLPNHGASRSCWQEGKHWCGSDSF